MACMGQFMHDQVIDGRIIIGIGNTQGNIRQEYLDDGAEFTQELREQSLPQHRPVLEHGRTAQILLVKDPEPDVRRGFRQVQVLF